MRLFRDTPESVLAIYAHPDDADVAAGGEGAPLAPLYHLALAADSERPLAVLNVGGVAKIGRAHV